MKANLETTPARPLQLLLVEDNEDDAYFLLRELQRAGYAVTCQRVQTAPAMRAALERRPRPTFWIGSSCRIWED